MASSSNMRDIDTAWLDASDFRSLFPTESYVRWEIAGSVRRGKILVSDVEHVIIPAFGEVPGGGIFGEPVWVNLLWRELERLVAVGVPDWHEVERRWSHAADTTYHGDEDAAPHEPDDWGVFRAIYTDKNGRDSHRWGDKYRGVLFRGFKHELFTATPETWGNILTIRTGPADFSQRLVTQLLSRGLRQQGGAVVYTRGASAGQSISCPTEAAFFKLCGEPYVAPEARTPTPPTPEATP